jgi:hypothetical protein
MLKRLFAIDPLILMSLSIHFCILRMVVPYANYLFLSFLTLYILYTVVYCFRSSPRRLFTKFIASNYFLLLISFFVFLGFGLSATYSLLGFKEVLYVLVVLLLSLTLYLYIDVNEKFEEFTGIFSKQLIFLSSVIGLTGILKFVCQLFGLKFSYVEAIGTSLVNDYNFYVLFGFLGLISLLFNRNIYRRNIFLFVFTLLNINVIFSGSRRGIFLLVLLWLLLFVAGIDFKLEYKLIRKRLLLVFSSIIVLISVYSLLTIYPLRINEKKSSDMQSDYQNQVHQLSARLLFRYYTIINNTTSYEDFYNDLWSGNGLINTTRVFRRWGKEKENENLLYNGNFKQGLVLWQPKANSTILAVVNTPFGKGVKVSRFDGDNDSWPLLYSGRKMVFHSNHTYNVNFKFKVMKGSKMPFKIGFDTKDSYYEKDLNIVSTDLEDGWKQATCFYTFTRSHASNKFFMNSLSDSSEVVFTDIKLTDASINEKTPVYADQISDIEKEVQQYLYAGDSLYNRPPVNLNLFANGDFSSGYLNWITESDSTSQKIIYTPFGKGLEISRSDGDGGSWTVRYVGRPIVYHAGHTYELRFLALVKKGEGFPFNVGWWVNDGGQGYDPTVALTKKFINKNDGWMEIVCSYRFRETHADLPTFLNSLQNNSVVQITRVELLDLDRNDSLPAFVDQINIYRENEAVIASKKIVGSEILNTSDFKSNKNKLYSVRTNRWIYSKVVFRDSLSVSQKIFGGGFDYLKMFGTEFGEVEYDYPHNPFLSAFLYSGIIGGLAYIWFMFLVFYYYIKYYRHHIYFFICFLVAFYFSFFSVNTHFTIAAFAFFSIIPFLTRYLVENEKEASDAPTVKTNP